ncbi:MAG TPA: dihydropteroate synthase [Chloroflexi bacterium]|nr:dihydropteroate synthase [Chloroflexota bacterium]
MLIVGERIHITAPTIQRAIAARDVATIQRIARAQAARGATFLDLGIGPQRRNGPEVMAWMVDAVQEAADVGLSLDTTNLAAMEAGLRRARRPAMVNATSAEAERLQEVPAMAARYGAKLIALMMGPEGVPVTAEERVAIASERLVPRAVAVGIPMENLYLDPLVLTVAGCQPYCREAIEAVRAVKRAIDPPPKTICGLSNVSHSVAREHRSLLNRVYLVMLMAAGLGAVIADPLDGHLMATVRRIAQRTARTPADSLLLALYDATAAGEELEPSRVDRNDPDQVAIWRAVEVLLNRTPYDAVYPRR